MKRNNLFVLILFINSLLFPVLTLFSKLLQYSLKVDNGIIYAVITTAIYYSVGILLLANKEKCIGKAQTILLAVTLLLNQINALFFIFTAENMLAMLLVASWFVMTVVIVAFYVKSAGLKATFYSLSGILVLPICLCILLSDFGANTVLAHEISPNSTFCAEVIDDDQGALGGATILNVYKYDKSFSIGSFVFRKDEKKVYSGRWGEYKSLYWIDDNNLKMNNTTYSMSSYYH
jgi:hypothetical protein